MENHTLNRILLLITMTLLLGIAAAFFTGFLKVTPAYARGSVQVSTSKAQAVRIVSASWDDPGRRRDPGQDQHVGWCTAALRDQSVAFNVYRGYPDYQCALSLRLQNRGEKALQLQSLEADLPEGILLIPPDPTDRSILQPGAIATFKIGFRILPNAAENVTYPISIQLVFEDSPR